MASDQIQPLRVNTTKFPSIEKLRHLVSSIQYHLAEASIQGPRSIPLVGTTKLHGAHFDIVITSLDEIRLQSRNILNLTLEQDVFGFAKWMQSRLPVALKLRDEFHRRYAQLNPTIPINPKHHFILACELTGPGVQKGVAVSKLGQRLVILTASINGAWLPDGPYGDISAEEADVCNVLRGGMWNLDLNLDEPETTEAEMMRLTDVVEKECPFAKAFGISGTGEGIVWKVADTILFPGPLFWCKTKGDKHAVSHVKKMPVRGPEEDKAIAFADAVVTTSRLEQMWTTLKEEMKLPMEKKSIGEFLKLLVDDCLKEEREEMKEQGVDEKHLKKAINSKGKEWFTRRLREEDTR